MTNPEGVVDVWGAFGDETWAVGLGLGNKGANFQRETSATIPSTTFSTTDWQITEWSDIDCSDVDYSTIGAYTYSTGVAPSVTTQPTDPVFACAFSASMSVAGIGHKKYTPLRNFRNMYTVFGSVGSPLLRDDVMFSRSV